MKIPPPMPVPVSTTMYADINGERHPTEAAALAANAAFETEYADEIREAALFMEFLFREFPDPEYPEAHIELAYIRFRRFAY